MVDQQPEEAKMIKNQRSDHLTRNEEGDDGGCPEPRHEKN